MATTALVSTVVMGGVLLAIVALMLRLRGWQHPTASTADVHAGRLAERVNGPLGWSVAFFVVTFGLMGLVMAYATGGSVAGLNQATLGLLSLGAVAVVVTGAGIVAVYAAVRSRGLNSAQAAGVSSVLFATIVLVAIVVQLFVGG